jgi:hypothetical protein
VKELGNFKDRDFQISEAAGYLTRKLAGMYERRYAELTRTRQKALVNQVLAELLSSFGPSRVRLHPASIAQLHRGKERGLESEQA